MARPGQHVWLLQGAIAMVMVLAACGSTDTPTVANSGIAQPVSMPAVRIPGLHASNATLDRDTVAGEATHPDGVAAMLDQAGFLGVTDRTLTGRRGLFSRVVVRGWSFASAAGASSFLDWLRTNAAEFIGDTEAVDSSGPAGVVLLVHSPSGCCHEEVPIYLGAWQRTTAVWTVRASGARIRTAPALELFNSIKEET